MRNIITLVLAAMVAIVAVGCAPAEEAVDNGPAKGKGAIENKNAESNTNQASSTSNE